MDIPIVFQDESLMVVDKPPGLVVDPSETQKDQTLADILQSKFKIHLDRGGVVHRLDKDTSGLLLVAKTQLALETLQSQFKERKVSKEYLALVHGQITQTGDIKGAIGRNPGKRENFIVTSIGREAETKYEPIKSLKLTDDRLQAIFTGFTKIQFRKLLATNYQHFTLLCCFPLTGRTHQIRVHLKYINHPVVGDEKYAGRKTVRLDRRWCPRQFLHATKISFYHPMTGEKMEFGSALPNDLKAVLTNLTTQTM